MHDVGWWGLAKEGAERAMHRQAHTAMMATLRGVSLLHAGIPSPPIDLPTNVLVPTLPVNVPGAVQIPLPPFEA